MIVSVCFEGDVSWGPCGMSPCCASEEAASKNVRTEKRTTDMRRVVLRCTPGGVAYALHDPVPSSDNEVGSLARLFLICPQAPLNEFHAEGEFLL